MRKPTRTEVIVLALLLLLAAGLRLTRLGLVEFKYDEATMARMALQIAREGRWPALGMISSQGPHNPPLMNYLLALPFSLSRDPRLASGWIALLGVVAVGLTYLLGRAYFGRRVGALAALLFAVSPWAVFHSRKIWAQNVPALTLLFILALLALIVRRKRWALTGALAAAAGLVGLHLGGLAFFFILAATLALFPRRVRPLPLLAGLLLVLLILSSYLIHDARHDWANLRAFATMAEQEATLDLQAPRMAGWIAGGHHLADLAGERHADFTASILDLRWLDRVQIALFWLGVIWLGVRVVRDLLRRRLTERTTAYLVLLLWLGVPLLLLLRHSAPIYPHTLSLLYPVQHLIVALLLVEAIEGLGQRRTRRIATAGAMGLVLALAGWQVYLQQSLLTYVDHHDTPGGYGAPLKYPLAAARRAEALAADREGEVIALLPGADPRYDGDAAVFDVLLWPHGRLVDGRNTLVLPAGPAVYLAHPAATPGRTLLASRTTGEPLTLPLRGGSSAAYHVLPRSPQAVDPPHPVETTPTQWANGVTLLGYAWAGEPAPGDTFRWTLYWRVDGLPPTESDFHWFNHLIDAEGARWGQADGATYAPGEWRVGDVALHWFDVPVDPQAPAPPYRMRVGMYTYPEIVNVQMVDVAGNPSGEFVVLGPLGATP